MVEIFAYALDTRMNDPVISQFSAVPFGDDLMYCYDVGLMYQKDTSKSIEYGQEYFENYVTRENTKVANALNFARTSLAEKYCKCVLDVGIGSGEFIKSLKIAAFGYDINPYGVDWLKEREIYIDPWKGIPAQIEGVTLWDTIEHMPEPSAFLSLISSQYVFISLPVFTDLTKIRSSKHYKQNEHYLYVSAKGLISYMFNCGFNLVEMSDAETLAGREDVLSFVFRRF